MQNTTIQSKVLAVKNISDSAYILRIERNNFNFKAGQYLTLSIPNEQKARHYSIYSTEKDNFIEEVNKMFKAVVEAVLGTKSERDLKKIQPKVELINSLEAEIKILVKDASVVKILKDMGDDLKRFLQVAKVEFADSEEGLVQYDNSFIFSQRSSGKKCVRCWNFFDELGSDPAHPELCIRCTDIVKNL